MQNNIYTWGHREKTALQMHDTMYGTKKGCSEFFLNIGNDAPRHYHSTFVSLRLTSLLVCLHAGLRSTCTKKGFVVKMRSKVVCFDYFLASGDLCRLLMDLYKQHARIQMGEGAGDPTAIKPQKYRISRQYWSGCPEKSQSYQTSFQCWAIIGPPAKRHLNGVSLAGR